MQSGNGDSRKFTSEQKYKIIKEALTSDSGVSEVCKKYGIHTSRFYHWQETFLKGAREGFESNGSRPGSAELRRITALEKENGRLKEVIAEITSENISFKKSLGEL